MDDNSLSVDLRKVKKTLPPPPVSVAPLSIAPEAPKVIAAAAPSPVPSRPEFVIPALPPRPRRGFMAKMPVFSWIYVAILAVLLGLAVGGYYIYEDFWTKSPFGATATSTAPGAAASVASASNLTEAEIIAAVGKLMLLPSDETPTLAKVSDPAVLQSQIFFKNAVVGDIVLMYPKSLRAILFDPMQDKIIEVGPITAASASTSAAATSTRR